MTPELRQYAIDLILQLAGFLIAFGILKKLFWQQILNMLDERRARIAAGLEDVERAKAEMATLKTRYEQELARIEEAARQKLLEVVNEGRRVAAEIEEDARAKAQASLAKAKETLELEVAKAKVALRDQIVALALEATEKLLRRQLDDAQDRRLVEQFITELDGEPGPTTATAPAKARG